MLPRGIALRIRPAAGAILCSMFAAVALCGCSKRASIKTPSGIVLRSQSVSLPAHGREFAGGPEAGMANTYCLMCHSGGMVMTQPQLTLAQWQAELHKMISTYGCPLPVANIDQLAQFLAQASQNPASLTAAPR